MPSSHAIAVLDSRPTCNSLRTRDRPGGCRSLRVPVALTLVKPLRKREAERGADRIQPRHLEYGKETVPHVQQHFSDTCYGWQGKRTKRGVSLMRVSFASGGWLGSSTIKFKGCIKRLSYPSYHCSVVLSSCRFSKETTPESSQKLSKAQHVAQSE